MKASGGEVSPLVVSPQNSARPTWENSTLRQKKKASSPTCLAAVQSSCDFFMRGSASLDGTGSIRSVSCLLGRCFDIIMALP